MLLVLGLEANRCFRSSKKASKYDRFLLLVGSGGVTSAFYVIPDRECKDVDWRYIEGDCRVIAGW